MRKTRINELKKDLKKIKNKFERDAEYSSDDLVKWSVYAASIFEEIGIPDKIINDFLTVFNINYLNEDKISPFMRRSGNPIFVYRTGFKERLSALWTAIEYAEIRLKYIEFEDSLIPRWLLKAVSENEELNHIFSSLSSLDKAFNNRSAEDLHLHTVTLLDSILNLDNSIKGKDIGTKLQILIEDKKDSERKKFGGLSPDFFRGLNNSRLIRNVRVVHPVEKMKHDIPFIVGIASAYLVIILLEVTLARGDLIKK